MNCRFPSVLSLDLITGDDLHSGASVTTEAGVKVFSQMKDVSWLRNNNLGYELSLLKNNNKKGQSKQSLV